MMMEKEALENLEVTVTVCFFFPDGTCGVVRVRVAKLSVCLSVWGWGWGWG